jgi:glycosyltransferase involved in cell wall biosynthesis
MKSARVLAIVPAHNEADSLPGVIREVRTGAPDLDLLVVDDGSTDASLALLRRAKVRHVHWDERMGVGAAVRAGLTYADRLGYSCAVRLDGDGQHPASQIDQLLRPIREERADLVIGSRYRDGGTYPSPRGRRLAQWALARGLSMMTRGQVTDPTSGFLAFGPAAIDLLAEHHPGGYGEPELLLYLWRSHLRVLEVPVEMRERIAGQTSLTMLRLLGTAARMLLVVLVTPLRPAPRGARS